MKEWWMHLSLRDKRFLSGGGILIALFLFYEIFFATINNSNATLREEILHNQKLLTWMQEADQRKHVLEKLSAKNAATKNPAELLSILQKQINHSIFKPNMTLLVQSESDLVQMNFHAVDFDNFIKWLITQTTEENLIIKQMTVTANGNVGIVDASVFLQ